MLAGHWSVFRGAGHFPHNLLMFCRFLVSFFHVINLSDVSWSLYGFQMYGAFSIQPANVQQVTGQFSDMRVNRQQTCRCSTGQWSLSVNTNRLLVITVQSLCMCAGFSFWGGWEGGRTQDWRGHTTATPPPPQAHTLQRQVVCPSGSISIDLSLYRDFFGKLENGPTLHHPPPP